MSSQVNGCYGSSGDTLISSNEIIQTSPNWIYNSILEWDINVTLFAPESDLIRSYIEVREYVSSEFCESGTTDSGFFGQYEFDIPYIPTNQTGSITIRFDQDFFKKCFEWRIVTEGVFANNQTCFRATEWQFHSIFD